MLNKLNIESVKSKVSNHLMSYMPCMIKYKSSIQREILSLLAYSDTCDIRDCRFNAEVVEKLVALGKKHYASSDKTDETVYCICMAIGTIIKEYDWGVYYIQSAGMCEIAAKIQTVF